MKNLSLRRFIPVAAAGALLSIGCGGKAIDNGDGDSDGGPPGNPSPGPGSDPLSDQNFEESLSEDIDLYCDRQVGCGEFGSQAGCTSIMRDVLEQGYDLESRPCRALALETFDCVNDAWQGCDSPTDPCEGEAFELYDDCFDGAYEDDFY